MRIGRNNVFLFTTLLFLVIAGKPNNPPINNENTNQLKDSVLILLKQSKDPLLPDDKRLNILYKAHDLTNSTKNDSLRAKYLGLLSYRFLYTPDSAQFRHINKKAIDLNKLQKDSTALANAYWDLAVFYNRYKIKDSAFQAFSESQKIFELKGDFKVSSRLLIYMAEIQLNIKDYIAGETTLIKVIKQLKPLKNNKLLFEAYNKLGIALGAQSEVEKSFAYFNEALYYLKQDNNDKVHQARVLNNKGIVFRNNNDHQQAIENFQKVLITDSLKIKNPELYAKALTNLASSKINIGDTLGIKNLLTESAEIKRKENDLASLASTFFTFSQYYAFGKDSSTSLNYAKKAIELAKETNNNERLLKTWAYLTEIDKPKAHEYAKQYITLNDSLQREERIIQNKFARIRFETDEYIAENIELESETKVLSKEKKIWAGIAAGILLLGLSLFIIISQRAKNQKLSFQQQQQASNQEIFNLMLTQKQKVDEVKRLEQKRISEELHDGVLSKMLGARMVLTGLNKRADESSIQERSAAIAALKTIENEVRHISHELSHSAYQKISNFTNSIETLLNNTELNSEIKTLLTFDEDEDWDSLEGDIKINLYRIIQETLQNAIKHADCKNFYVHFTRNEHELFVTMGDDGKGFNLEKKKKGIGMRNIKSRIHKLNGFYEIETSPDNGTLLKLKIPLTKNLDSILYTKDTIKTV